MLERRAVDRIANGANAITRHLVIDPAQPLPDFFQMFEKQPNPRRLIHYGISRRSKRGIMGRRHRQFLSWFRNESYLTYMGCCRKVFIQLCVFRHTRNHATANQTAIIRGTPMIPFVTMTDSRGQKISVNPEIVQFVRLADGREDECLIVFGKDQLLRVRGTLEDVTDILREG
jgi:hypothetical protein